MKPIKINFILKILQSIFGLLIFILPFAGYLINNSNIFANTIQIDEFNWFTAMIIDFFYTCGNIFIILVRIACLVIVIGFEITSFVLQCVVFAKANSNKVRTAIKISYISISFAIVSAVLVALLIFIMSSGNLKNIQLFFLVLNILIIVYMFYNISAFNKTIRTN